MYVAAAILVAASLSFVAIGSIYKWDVTAEGYAKWSRVAGVVSVLALAVVAAYGRIDEPLVALTIIVGGIALAVVFVMLHKKMTERVRMMLDR
jgi:uncharacterized membrane protein